MTTESSSGELPADPISTDQRPKKLTGISFWIPITTARFGSAVIGLLAGMSAYTAVEAKAINYLVTFIVVGILGMLIPPAIAIAAVQWINRQAKTTHD